MVTTPTTTPTTDDPPRGARRPMRWLVVVGGLLSIAGIVALSMTRDSDGPSEPLPIIATVPDFSLTERSGRTVTRSDLLGSPWVIDFFFTSCTGPCPEMTLRMRSLGQTVLDERLGVTLVSLSLDPEIDRPSVLRRYADKYGADPNRWLFLTGEDQAVVHELVKTGFLVGVQRATSEAVLVHATYFLLIDSAGRIRGVYEGLEASSKPRILADLRQLLAERPSS